MLFGPHRVLRDQQDLWTAQGDGLLEACLSQSGGGYLSGQVHCAGSAHAGVHAEMIEARLDLDAARPERLALGADLDDGGGALGRTERDVDGKRLAAENLRGQAHGLQAQVGLGPAGERVGVHRDAELACLPGGAHHAAQILVPIGDEDDARHQAGGKRGGAIA